MADTQGNTHERRAPNDFPTAKRPPEDSDKESPSIQRHQQWGTTIPNSLARRISPPPSRAKRKDLEKACLRNRSIHPGDKTTLLPNQQTSLNSLASIEAGTAHIDSHLAKFSSHLSKLTLPASSSVPRIALPAWQYLYEKNQHARGCHFVIHQHDHPVAGTHYDLRLQINEASSVSWSIPYGVPGLPNGRRRGRAAIETRVHCLWNHLIETASHATGSLLIWDTGEYSILPQNKPSGPEETSDSSASNSDSSSQEASSEPQKLHDAFQKGKIHLRLHGTRLPQNYTVTLHRDLTSHNPKSSQARQRRRQKPARKQTPSSPSTSPSPPNSLAPSPPDSPDPDPKIRAANAYPGADNTINSQHQRLWFLSLDKAHSGFQARVSKDGSKTWERRRDGTVLLAGFEGFLVEGREVERSVVTGRLAAQVCIDEGVVGFVGRAGWRALVD